MQLLIHAKKDGFRRAGMTFRENEPTLVDTKEVGLSASQIQALKDEPNLVVLEVKPSPETIKALANGSAGEGAASADPKDKTKK